MADVSSYNQPLPTGPLDMINKLQTLEQQKIGIDQSKLKLMNDHFQIMNGELSTMANDPNITKDTVIKRLTNIADTLNMPAPVRNQMIGEFSDVHTSQELQERLATTLKRGMTKQEQLNQQYGVQGLTDTGGRLIPTATSQMNGVKQTGTPINQEISPAQLNQPVNIPNAATGRTDTVPLQRFIEQTGGQVGGPQQIAPMAPQAPRLPVQMPQAAPQGRTAVQGQSPLLETGTKQYAEDQAMAAQRATAIKPLSQALSAMDGLRSGPGTETFNKAVAFLKANGIINIEQNDPTAIYQEVKKKINQYVQSSPLGQRSDIAQTLAQASNPDLGVQISPALIKLARDALALERVQISRPNAFKSKNNAEYGNHMATYPQSIDERAFTIDKMSPVERNALIKDMQKKKNTPEGKKFWKSLSIADEQGLLEPSQ